MIQILLRFGVIIAICVATFALFERAVWLATTPFSTQDAALADVQLDIPGSGSSANLETPTPAAYPQTLSRPIFFEGRKFPQPASLQAVAPPESETLAARETATIVPSDGIKLRGVLLTAGGWKALIEARERPATWHQVGEKLDEWEIMRIDSNRAVLVSARGQAILELYPDRTLN